MSKRREQEFKVIAETAFAKNVARYLLKTYLLGRYRFDPGASFQSAWYEIDGAFRAIDVDVDTVHEEVRIFLSENED